MLIPVQNIPAIMFSAYKNTILVTHNVSREYKGTAGRCYCPALCKIALYLTNAMEASYSGLIQAPSAAIDQTTV